jgi:hypothetical protein
MQRTEYLNAQDKNLSRELASYDIPQRLVISGIWNLPFGRRQKWAREGWPAKLMGGWQVSSIATSQAGPPVSMPNYLLHGDPRLPDGQQTLGKWFDTSNQIWVQPPPDTLRTTKMRSPNIRRHTAPQFNTSVLRTFSLSEKGKVQFKGSAFNLTNTPIFGQPNTTPASPLFGVVPITQINLSRSVELGFRFFF